MVRYAADSRIHPAALKTAENDGINSDRCSQGAFGDRWFPVCAQLTVVGGSDDAAP